MNGNINTSSRLHNKTEASSDVPEVTQLAAKVAHELNNPLDAVLRYVSLAQRKARAGDFTDIERYLNDAQFGLQRMAEILRDLMEIGRETDAILRSPQKLPLPEVIGHARRTVAGLAEQRKVHLKLLGEIRADIHADIRLAQVLANVLKNAIEASTISGEDVCIRLSVESQNPAGAHSEPAGGNMLRIDVCDRGPGIPEELLPRLFTPFVTTKPKGAGHGLGLAISRELMATLYGTLTIANQTAPEAGCIATLRVPITNN